MNIETRQGHTPKGSMAIPRLSRQKDPTCSLPLTAQSHISRPRATCRDARAFRSSNLAVRLRIKNPDCSPVEGEDLLANLLKSSREGCTTSSSAVVPIKDGIIKGV